MNFYMNYFTALQKPTKSYAMHSITLNDIFISILLHSQVCSKNWNGYHLDCHNSLLSIWPNVFKNFTLLYFWSLSLFTVLSYFMWFSYPNIQSSGISTRLDSSLGSKMKLSFLLGERELRFMSYFAVRSIKKNLCRRTLKRVRCLQNERIVMKKRK